jgi:hypothetical protein
MTLGRRPIDAARRHASRRSLAPIREHPQRDHGQWEHDPPEDPHGVRQKQPANAVTVPGPRTPADAPPLRSRVLVRSRLVPVMTRLSGTAAEVLAVAAVAANLAVVALTTPGQPGEAFGIGRVIAAARPDVGPLPSGWPGRTFGAVVAAWMSLTGALPRHATSLTAVREAILVAALVVLGCAWLVARRLRLAPPTRVAAVLLVGALPLATGLLTTVRPGVIAGAAVAAVTAAVAGDRVGRSARVFGIVALAAAAALVPAMLPALLAALAVLLAQGDLGARLPRAIRYGLAAAVGGLALAGLAVARAGASGVRGGARDWLVSASPAPAPTPELGELPLLLAVLALIVAALGRRWLRVPATGVVVLLITALLVEPAHADLLTLGLPVLAVVAVASAEDLFLASNRAWGLALSPRYRAGVAAIGVLVAGATFGGVLSNRPAPPSAPPVHEVTAWFRNEVPGDVPIFVDDALWPELLRAGMPASRLHTLGSSGYAAASYLARAAVNSPTAPGGPGGAGAPGGPGGAGAPGGPAQWRIATGDVNRAGALAAGWLPLAAFGFGPGRVTVLHALPPPPNVDPVLDPENRTRRLREGAALSVNPRVVLSAAAADALRRGDVDLRMVVVLTELAKRHDLGVTEFPVVPGEQAGTPPMRRVLISTVDGHAATDPGTNEQLRRWFNSQSGPYFTRAVDVTAGGVLVRYPAGPPPGGGPPPPGLPPPGAPPPGGPALPPGAPQPGAPPPPGR